MKAASSEQSSDSVVLVVDDDPDVREGIETLLHSVSLQSKAYASASEFFGSKLSDQASCLILDVRLPGLSGFEFQAELAKEHINIPIIFITGHGDVRMSVKAMKAGAVEFLTKPFREQELLDAVRIALDRDRKRREHEDKINDLRLRYNALSQREEEVMTFVVAGLMNKQVAAEIGIAEVTTKVHRHNLMKKLDAKSLADLVRMAGILGLPHAKEELSELARKERFAASTLDLSPGLASPWRRTETLHKKSNKTLTLGVRCRPGGSITQNGKTQGSCKSSRTGSRSPFGLHMEIAPEGPWPRKKPKPD